MRSKKVYKLYETRIHFANPPAREKMLAGIRSIEQQAFRRRGSLKCVGTV